MTSPDPAADPIAALDAFEAAGRSAFAQAQTAAEVEAVRVEYLGMRQGKIKAYQERIKTLEPAERKGYGQRFNAVKQALESYLEDAKVRVEVPPGVQLMSQPSRVAQRHPSARFQTSRIPPPNDLTLPGHPRPHLGHKHPLTQTADELIELFGRFGFQVARGPEVEDIHHNFEALNIPHWHPARDVLDNFYLSDGALLRTQTSTVQIRVMERQPPPVRVIAIGRVYRPDVVDATHSFMFQQIEGLMVDRGVTMADLKTVLRLFAESYLGKDVQIRFRPSFFPFTEPSVEVDMLWHGGQRWVEMGGAGMVDPNVLRAVNYNPEEVTGFAFGLGIERLCMRRHGIDDIRLLYQNDVRFLSQF